MTAVSDGFDSVKKSASETMGKTSTQASKMGDAIAEGADKMAASTSKTLKKWGTKISSFFD